MYLQNDNIQSRSDYPDFDDMSSFFDFDLVPSSESDREYDNQFDSESNSESSEEPPRRNKYYYYYKADGPRYTFDPNPPKKQLVTPGTHYKPENDKDIAENVSTESKPPINQAVVGPYQVSVVDADSPMLTNLGLNKDDLMKLSGHTKRSTSNASMVGSDSVPPATYAENPRQDHPPPNYPPQHSHASNHPPPYEQSGNNYPPERSYRPNEYYPAENQGPHRGYGSGQPPPQGSYDPKSYHHSPPPHSPPPSSYYPPPSSPSRSYSPYPPSYAPKRSSEVPWRQVPSTHTDWDDKQNKKPEPYHGHSHYQPPPSHGSSPSSSQYPKPSYGSSEKQGYRYSSYSKPTYSSPSSSDYHSHKHSPPPSSSEYHSHAHSPSSSSDYHSHKHSYPSSSYSSSAKAPSRAGSVSHGLSHESSKPGITIRFKAKAPAGHESSGHGGSGGHGLSIPLNFNPLDVVKKLIPSLNPLNNKKVTIGITIENKKEPHIDFQSY